MHSGNNVKIGCIAISSSECGCASTKSVTLMPENAATGLAVTICSPLRLGFSAEDNCGASRNPIT